MRVDDATQERAVGGWTAEKQLAAGQQRGDSRELAWNHGGAVNTGLQRQ